MKRNDHIRIMLTAIACYVVTAIASDGYYHPDEHYQLIEFAGLKLGTNTTSDLAWEYNAQIRSSLQPAICVVVFKCLNGMGVHDPYLLALGLRLLTAILAIGCIALFARSMLPMVEPRNQKVFILLSYFLWFLPVLNVRFSSEAWSGMLFLLAVALVQKNEKRNLYLYTLAGLAVAASFLCRYQSGMLAAGLIGWLIFIRKERWVPLLVLTGAVAIGIQLGLLLDYWFYGKYAFTFWNYFYVNNVLGIASHFGVSPWYYYLIKIPEYAFWPIGLLILLALVALCIGHPRSILTWCILPFLIVHSIIPHKEERFIFPLANFAPAVLILGWQQVRHLFFFKDPGSIVSKIGYASLIILAVINTTGLVCMTLKTVGVGRACITRYIKNTYGNRPILLAALPGANPFNPWPGLPGKFYGLQNVTEQNINKVDELPDPGPSKKQLRLVVIRKEHLKDPWLGRQLGKMHFTRKAQSVSGFIERIGRYYAGFREEDILILYSNE